MSGGQRYKQQRARFVEEYLIDLNATQAAIRAGYKPKTANRQGSRLLSYADIQEAIAARRRELSRETGITQERVLAEYAKLAFYDPRAFYDDNGDLIPIKQLDDQSAAAVAGMDVASTTEGELPVTIRKIKLADKKGALDSIARHLGMFNDKLDVNIKTGLAERVRKARERATGN